MTIDKKILDQSFSPEEEDKKNTALKAYENALKITQEKGLEVGQKVYHPSDDCVYQLYEINEGVAVVGLPNGIRKEFPADELIDPDIAYSEAMKIHMEKKSPGINN